jgi:hypothetical protein
LLKWAWVLAIAGVAAGLTLLGMLLRRKPSIKEMEATQGVIMKSESWEAVTNYGNVPSARVTFNYVVNGTPHTSRQSWANGPEPPTVGSPVTVYYVPGRPDKASLVLQAESSGRFATMLFLVLLTVSLTGSGLFMLLTILVSR